MPRKIDPTDVSARTVHLRLSDKLEAEARRAAVKAGLPLSEFIRASLAYQLGLIQKRPSVRKR